MADQDFETAHPPRQGTEGGGTAIKKEQPSQRVLHSNIRIERWEQEGCEENVDDGGDESRWNWRKTNALSKYVFIVEWKPLLALREPPRKGGGQGRADGWNMMVIDVWVVVQ
jgi:hypothetical protein